MWELKDSVLSSKIFWFTFIAFSIYLYVKKICFSYWEKHGVPHRKPIFPVGNFTSDLFMRKINFGNFWKRSCEAFKDHPFHGAYLFLKPVLIVTDPELSKQILIKDFTKFADRGVYYNQRVDPLSENLFFMEGEKWKIARAKLSPAFTSIKIKCMFPILMEIGNEVLNSCNESLLKSDIVEIKNIMARFTIDVIFNVAFGCNINTLKGQDDDFYYYGNLAVKNSPIRNLLMFFMPGLSKILGIAAFNPKATNFFKVLFCEMVEKRKMEKVKKQDCLNFMIELMDKEQRIESEDSVDNDITDKITEKMELLQAAAQAFIFFLAGFETSSSVATHLLYELALNPHVQSELQKEIDEVLASDNGVTYDSILQMKYLDMVICEAMRMHPSVSMLHRVCLENCQIPNSNFEIPKGMAIIIPITGLHNNPTFFPEPDKFDPTRFSKEKIETIKPCTFIPFGEGPRYCIGKRLGLIQMKIAVFKLLSNFTFSVCEKTTIPAEYSPDCILQTPKDGVYLRVRKRI